MSPQCQSCKRRRLTRLLSRFAYHQGEDARLRAFDTSAPRDESFYRDSRNVGLWAKKRAKEMGLCEMLTPEEAAVPSAMAEKLRLLPDLPKPSEHLLPKNMAGLDHICEDLVDLLDARESPVDEPDARLLHTVASQQ